MILLNTLFESNTTFLTGKQQREELPLWLDAELSVWFEDSGTFENDLTTPVLASGATLV
jgi:hypothetical protein